jgi:ATP-dependent RNA helicase DHX8/PRP22
MASNNNRNLMPEVGEIYHGKVVDVIRHGVMVRLNGFHNKFVGLLTSVDSPIVSSLIEKDPVKVRLVSCMSDGFISITCKDIEQPKKVVDNSKKKAVDETYEKQKRKIRVASPNRSDTKQFTAAATNIGIEVITTEPDFLRNISGKMPSKIPMKVEIVKGGNNYMAEVAEEKNKSNWPSPFYYQQASFSYEWIAPLNVSFKKMQISSNQASDKPLSVIQRNEMSIQEQRQSLPIYNYREEIIRAVTDNQFLILQGETGSGKTTQITQYLIEAGFLIRGKIVCTQPRRVAAVSVATRVAEEFGCEIGQEVGYKIRFEDVTSPTTIIKYMTDGILLRECLSDASLDAYSVIILDEAHERSIFTDVLFGILKEAAKRRPNMRVVISSATLDAQKFSKFFNNAKVLTLPGCMFPVEIKFRVMPEQNYFCAAVNTVLNIHAREPAGDILCFLTGQDEIDRACEIVDKKAIASSEFSDLYAYPFYSAMSLEEETDIFTPTPPGQRKVIFSTNVAETSMTIDGVVYVVDPGYVKQKIYDPNTGIESLTIVPISRASADQRCGRAGRTAPGKCYRIYTETSYLFEMLDATVPGVQRSNVANVILQLKAIGIDDVLNFDFMDPPPRDCLISALKDLYLLDALDKDGNITPTGRRMAHLPIDPKYAKMLIVSEDLKCSDEIITIIAMSSVPNIFRRPKRMQVLADEKRNSFNHPVGDHLRLLNVYNKYELNYDNPYWFRFNFVNEKKLYAAWEIRKHLLSILESHNIEVYSANKNIERIQLAICSGFLKNIAFKDSRGKSYKTLENGRENVYMHPSSSVFYDFPQW